MLTERKQSHVHDMMRLHPLVTVVPCIPVSVAGHHSLLSVINIFKISNETDLAQLLVQLLWV